LQVEAEYEQVKAALQMEYQRCQAWISLPIGKIRS
jgi:hypothetical protein